MKRVAFLELAPAIMEIREALDLAYARVLNSGVLLFGDELNAFENEFAAYCGARHCIGVGNGLDALTLALLAIGVGDGDEVIVPGHTCTATWMAVSAAGARPVPVDVLPDTFNLNPELIESALTQRTKAILPVHLYGQCADMGRIRDIARSHQLPVIADAAQSAGATFGGVNCGALGDAAAFSFYPTKNLGALGDSGAVVTDRDDIAERVRLLRNYGSKDKNVHLCVGRNSRMEELQAAFLRARLAVLPEWNRRRRKIAGNYLDQLSRSPLELPGCHPDAESVWHLFTVRIPPVKREHFRQELTRLGIDTAIYYPTPPHLSAAFATEIRQPDLPVTEAIATSIVNLPLHPHLQDDQIAAVCKAVTSATASL